MSYFFGHIRASASNCRTTWLRHRTEASNRHTSLVSTERVCFQLPHFLSEISLRLLPAATLLGSIFTGKLPTTILLWFTDILRFQPPYYLGCSTSCQLPTAILLGLRYGFCASNRHTSLACGVCDASNYCTPWVSITQVSFQMPYYLGAGHYSSLPTAILLLGRDEMAQLLTAILLGVNGLLGISICHTSLANTWA